MLAANQATKAIIKTRITVNPSDLDLPIELAELENKISQLNYNIAQDVEIHLAEHEKNEYPLESKTHADQTNKLVTHREQVYALIVGQCTKLLLDKLKQDPTWSAVSKSGDPLALYAIIKRVILKQTDDQYPFAAIHEQVLAMHSTKQGTLTNAQWYERFNTRYKVARSIGVEFDNVTLLWEYCAGLLNNGAGAPYASLTPAEQD